MPVAINVFNIIGQIRPASAAMRPMPVVLNSKTNVPIDTSPECTRCLTRLILIKSSPGTGCWPGVAAALPLVRLAGAVFVFFCGQPRQVAPVAGVIRLGRPRRGAPPADNLRELLLQ